MVRARLERQPYLDIIEAAGWQYAWVGADDPPGCPTPLGSCGHVTYNKSVCGS